MKQLKTINQSLLKSSIKIKRQISFVESHDQNIFFCHKWNNNWISLFTYRYWHAYCHDQWFLYKIFQDRFKASLTIFLMVLHNFSNHHLEIRMKMKLIATSTNVFKIKVGMKETDCWQNSLFSDPNPIFRAIFFVVWKAASAESFILASFLVWQISSFIVFFFLYKQKNLNLEN